MDLVILGIVLLACAAAITLWTIVDASWWLAIDALLVLIYRRYGLSRSAVRWEWPFVLRLMLLALITALMGAALVGLAIQAFESPDAASISACIGAAILIVGLAIAFPRIRRYGAYYRAKQLLPVAQQAVQELQTHWPERTCELSDGTAFYTDGTVPGILVQKGPWPFWRFRESLGPMICRLPDGRIVFDVGSTLSVLEFHPSGMTPSGYKLEFAGTIHEFDLVDARRLNGHWHLAWYEMPDP